MTVKINALSLIGGKLNSLTKVGVEGTYLNLIKVIYYKPTAQYNTQW